MRRSEPDPDSAARLRSVIDVPWFFRPVFAFTLIQLGPVMLWLVLPRGVLNDAFQRVELPHLSLNAIMAYGLLVGGFAAGGWLGGQGRVAIAEPWSDVTRTAMFVVHYAAITFALASTTIVVLLVIASGLDVRAVILASQANLLRDAVYSSSSGAQSLIIGRHLVLAALVTWFALRRYEGAHPRTLPVILLISIVLMLFTSSRWTMLGVVLLTTLSRLSRERGLRRASGIVKPIGYLVMLLGLAFVFVAGVYLRAAGRWVGSSSATAFALAPFYEAVGYFVSPVSYSTAFVNGGVAFVRGLGLDNFFSFIFTVFNLPMSEAHRELITWSYNPLLNQIGLLGEWYTIMGPLLWIPAIGYGMLASSLYQRFRQHTLAGLLLYPFVLLSLYDSGRGFMLSQNIIAANLLYLGVGVLMIEIVKLMLTVGARHPPPVAHG